MNSMRKILFTGTCLFVLFIVFIFGCSKGGNGETVKEQPALIGLEKLDGDDELNIVNWKVQGTFGEPKLGSFDWELLEESSGSVWSGLAVKKKGIPDTVGVYFVDVNENDVIDIGDIFRVKAPKDSNYTVTWTQRSTGNPGRYDSHY